MVRVCAIALVNDMPNSKERVFSDRCYILGDCYGGEACATVERIISDSCYAVTITFVGDGGGDYELAWWLVTIVSYECYGFSIFVDFVTKIARNKVVTYGGAGRGWWCNYQQQNKCCK